MALENLDQKRARFAWECANNPANCNDEYKNSVKKLLPMIQANGLIGALSYFNAKGGKSAIVYNHIQQWLQNQRYVTGQPQLIQQLLDKDSMEIMDITREVVAVNGWLKRMVDCQ
jgi:CRISPR type III-B/RAMP module-associated protein Cmr5